MERNSVGLAVPSYFFDRCGRKLGWPDHRSKMRGKGFTPYPCGGGTSTVSCIPFLGRVRSVERCLKVPAPLSLALDGYPAVFPLMATVELGSEITGRRLRHGGRAV